MRGLGTRVTIGFLSIVALLFASGIISLFELSNLSNDTEVILAASRRNMEIAKDMLKSAHEHSQAVMHVAIFDEHAQRDVCRMTMSDLDGKIAAARSDALDVSCLDSLLLSAAHLREVTDQFVFTEQPSQIQLQTIGVAEVIEDSELVALRGKLWYDELYKPAYEELVEEIQRFMTHTHSSLAPRAEQLNKNAYRSVAPVFIAQVVMIAIVLMFYYFIRIYCVKPIEKINGSLSNYLSYRLPFGVKGDLLDELKELTDNIERLIGLSKQNRQ